jgi:hypothetical protein
MHAVHSSKTLRHHHFYRYFLIKAAEDKKSEMSDSTSQSKGGLFRGIASLFGAK